VGRFNHFIPLAGQTSASQSSCIEYDFSRAIWLPEPPEPVTIFLSSGEKLPARVAERLGNSLRVVIVVPVEHLYDSQLAGLVLEYANPCGRVRLTGRAAVERVSEGPVLRIDDATMIEAVEERAYARIEVDCPVAINVGRERLETRTVDLSGGGLLLDGPSQFDLGEELEFELTLTPGSLPVTGSARVARIDDRGRPAIQFTSISFSDRWRIVRFTLESQRATKSPPTSSRLAPVRHKDRDGEGGIRTLERGQPPLRDFQSRPFNRSGTSPSNATMLSGN
jgi:PilZ domain